MGRRKKYRKSRGLGEVAQRANNSVKPQDFWDSKEYAKKYSQAEEADIVTPDHDPQKKQNGNSILNETDKKVIRVLAYTTTALVIGGIGYLVIRTQLRKRKRLQAEKETLVDNTPENFAKRLIMAFDNDGLWGTDVESVRRVFVQIPSKEIFTKVAQKYSELSSSKKLLTADLEDELTSTEFYEMQSILAAKPEKVGDPPAADRNKVLAKLYARRLNSAINYTVLGFPATDEAAIKQVLTEIPSIRMWKATLDAYQAEYGADLNADLDGDISASDFSWRAILTKKPIG